MVKISFILRFVDSLLSLSSLFRLSGRRLIRHPGIPHSLRLAGRTATTALCLLCLGCGHYSYLANQLREVSSFDTRDLRSRDEVTFLVFGDSGSGRDAQLAVAKGMDEACDSVNGCDFALGLGDNIYENGAKGVDDEAFDDKFAKVYDSLGRLDIWFIPGNHDWHRPQSVQAQIDYTLQSNQWRMPYNHYAVPLLPEWLRLFGLDTSVFEDLAGQPELAKETELSKNQNMQLAAARDSLCGHQGWRLLFGHAPVYSGGRHGYEDGRAVLPSIQHSVECGVIERCNISVYFSGHDHHQELLFAAAKGYYQVVQGAAGKLRSVRKRHNDGVEQKFACSEYGFLLAHARRESLKMSFYGCGRKGHSGPCRRIYDVTLSLSPDGTLGLQENSVNAACSPQAGPRG